MRTFVQPGNDLNFVAAADVASGEVVVAGSLVGISTGAYKSGETGVFEVTGVHKVAKASATTFTQGAKVYYLTATKLATDLSNSGANPFLGYAAKAPAANATVVEVLLARPGE